MANVTLTYKGQIIAELDSQGTKTLKTAGKFCAANIVLDYVNRGPGAKLTASFILEDFFSRFVLATSAEEVASGEEEE